MKSNRLEELTQNYEALINRKNEICNNSNGIYKRYYHPVLTAEHAPLIWKYDFDEKQNPFMEERIGITAYREPLVDEKRQQGIDKPSPASSSGERY